MNWQIARAVAGIAGYVAFLGLLAYGAEKYVNWRDERARRLDGE